MVALACASVMAAEGECASLLTGLSVHLFVCYLFTNMLLPQNPEAWLRFSWAIFVSVASLFPYDQFLAELPGQRA